MNQTVLVNIENSVQLEKDLQIFSRLIVDMNERVLKDKEQFYSIGKLNQDCEKVEASHCKLLPEPTDFKPFHGAEGLAKAKSFNREKYKNIKNPFQAKLKASWNDKILKIN